MMREKRRDLPNQRRRENPGAVKCEAQEKHKVLRKTKQTLCRKPDFLV